MKDVFKKSSNKNERKEKEIKEKKKDRERVIIEKVERERPWLPPEDEKPATENDKK